MALLAIGHYNRKKLQDKEHQATLESCSSKDRVLKASLRFVILATSSQTMPVGVSRL